MGELLLEADGLRRDYGSGLVWSTCSAGLEQYFDRRLKKDEED
jgi:hypothetical protein